MVLSRFAIHINWLSAICSLSSLPFMYVFYICMDHTLSSYISLLESYILMSSSLTSFSDNPSLLTNFSLLFLFYFILFVCVCAHVCAYVCMPACTWRPEEDPLNLELQVACCPIWVLGTRIWSSARTGRPLSHLSSPLLLLLCTIRTKVLFDSISSIFLVCSIMHGTK